MTKILLLTNSEDVTTDFIVKELSNRKLSFYRFNTNFFLQTIDIDFNFQKNRFILKDTVNNIEIDLTQIQSVYYRRPELPDLSNYELNRQESSFVKGELLFAFEGIYKILESATWLNNVYRIRESENKIHQLQIALQLGFAIPDSTISNIPESILSFTKKTFSNYITKPLKSGLIEGTPSKVIFTSTLNSDIDAERFKLFPNFIQEKILKASDIRVTVVGTNVFAAEILVKDALMNSDWRSVSPEFISYREIDLPDQIRSMCVTLTQNLKLNFSAIDLILDRDGNFYFLEINPNGQWGWIEKQLNFGISIAITDFLEHAIYS